MLVEEQEERLQTGKGRGEMSRAPSEASWDPHFFLGARLPYRERAARPSGVHFAAISGEVPKSSMSLLHVDASAGGRRGGLRDSCRSSGEGDCLCSSVGQTGGPSCI